MAAEDHDYRRHYPRVELDGARAVLAPEGSSSFELEDLSARGLRVVGKLSLPVGAAVELRLEQTAVGPSTAGEPESLILRGKVVRLEPRSFERWAMAIEIEPLAEVTRRLLEMVSSPERKAKSLDSEPG